MSKQQQQYRGNGGNASPPPPPPQQHDEFDDEEMQQGGGGSPGGDITFRDIAIYTLRNYIFSLIGDMSSKLFVAPLERLNVLHQTARETERPDISVNQDLGVSITQAPRDIIKRGLGSTIWSGLVMQFWRTTLRSFTSSAFYIAEPMAGPLIASPTYFFYVRPVVIDVLNLLCVYPIDTAATISMVDQEPANFGAPTTVVNRVLANPKDSLRGFTITALGLVSYRAMLSTISSFMSNHDLIPHGLVKRFLLQNAVLFSCTALVYPCDTIRRRMITRKSYLDWRKGNPPKNLGASNATANAAAAATTASSSSSSLASSVDEGTRAIIKRIYQEEGIGGFFQGLSLRMTRMCGGALFYGLIQYMEMLAASQE